MTHGPTTTSPPRCAAPGSWSSASRRCRSSASTPAPSSRTFRPPATRGTRTTRPARHPAVRPPWSPQGSCPSRTRTTVAAPSGSRPQPAGSSGSSPRAVVRRRWRRPRSCRSTSSAMALSRAACATPPTSWPPPRRSSRPPACRRSDSSRVPPTAACASDSSSTPSPTTTDEETRAAVQDTATLLEKLGHTVVEVPLPVTEKFIADFTHYWSLLGFSTHHFGKRTIDPAFDKAHTDPLTRYLARRFVRQAWRTPMAIRALKRSEATYREGFAEKNVDVVLSPTLGHTTPRLGHLSPTVEFPEMFDRLVRYAAFTPLAQRRRRACCVAAAGTHVRRATDRRPPLRPAWRRAHPARDRLRARGRPPLREDPGLTSRRRLPRFRQRTPSAWHAQPA